MPDQRDYQRFRPHEIARSFPDTAETLLLDTYLTDEPAASARVFRVYRETPPHYHAGSDEYLYVLSGGVLSGWATLQTGGSSLLATSSSSNAGSFMPCPKFLRRRWSFSRSTHPDATRKTSSSSTLRTARRKALSGQKQNEIPTLSSGGQSFSSDIIQVRYWALAPEASRARRRRDGSRFIAFAGAPPFVLLSAQREQRSRPKAKSRGPEKSGGSCFCLFRSAALPGAPSFAFCAKGGFCSSGRPAAFSAGDLRFLRPSL